MDLKEANSVHLKEACVRLGLWVVPVECPGLEAAQHTLVCTLTMYLHLYLELRQKKSGKEAVVGWWAAS